MSTERDKNAAIQTEMLKIEIIEGLQRAIDNSYRRLRETARQEWERRFGGKDPSDVCVSVPINAATAETSGKALPLAGYLPKRAPVHHGPTRPRVA